MRRALIAAGVAAVMLTACPQFQGPTPMPAPYIKVPSDATVSFAACRPEDGIHLGQGNRCMWWKVYKPGQSGFYYRRGPYNPGRGECTFYPQFGDVYVGDEWPGTNEYLRVFTVPAPC